jgi:hypothetical protein
MADEIRKGGSRRDLRSIRASMRSKGLFGSIVTPRSNFSPPVVGDDIGVPTFPIWRCLRCVQIVAHRVRSVVTSLEKPRRSLVDSLQARPSVGARASPETHRRTRARAGRAHRTNLAPTRSPPLPYGVRSAAPSSICPWLLSFALWFLLDAIDAHEPNRWKIAMQFPS